MGDERDFPYDENGDPIPGMTTIIRYATLAPDQPLDHAADHGRYDEEQHARDAARAIEKVLGEPKGSRRVVRLTMQIDDAGEGGDE